MRRDFARREIVVGLLLLVDRRIRTDLRFVRRARNLNECGRALETSLCDSQRGRTPQRFVDQRIELWIAIRRPPRVGWPGSIRRGERSIACILTDRLHFRTGLARGQRGARGESHDGYEY